MTVDLARERDVVIVGAGPAGTSAAFFLANLGLDVLILEAKSHSRVKPCGDGLGPRAVIALQKMGLGNWLANGDFYKIDRLRIVAPSGAAIAAMAKPGAFPVTYGYVIKRDELDDRLVKNAVAAGAEIINNFHVGGLISAKNNIRSIPERTTGVVGTLRGTTHHIKAKLTILADGSKGRLSNASNIKSNPPQAVGLRAYAANVSGIDDCINIFFSSRFPNGYSWIFPTGPTTANVGVGLLRSNRAHHGYTVRSAYSYLISKQDLTPLSLKDCVIHKPPVGSIMRMGFGRRLIQQPGMACVGDAAGLVSPLNGEGISHALESGRFLAEQLDGNFSSVSEIDKALVSFETILNNNFLAYFKWARFLSRILARPERLNRLITKAQNDSYLQTTLSGVLANTVHPRELGRFKTLARILF